MRERTLRACAKLNLFLHLHARRADGYHDLESLVVFTDDLADEMSLAPAHHLSLSVLGEFAYEAGTGDGNLVLKAARALQQRTGCQKGAAITLHKHIPVGAGLGGGSADAAAALYGLNRLWALELTAAELHPMAVSLGADVAMCLASKPALVTGIGEIIAPWEHPLPPMVALLVHPRVPLFTKDVYARTEIARADVSWTGEAALTASAFWERLAASKNHLQRAAVALNPSVAEVMLALETLQPSSKLVRMTGSGACCFALYDTREQAMRAEENLTRHYPDWWVRVTALQR